MIIFILIVLLGFGWSSYAANKKMKEYKKHVKACKKRGIKHDESMWIPR